MAKSSKEIAYWSSVAVYGVLLVGVLLYLRFPTAKFRQFCEQWVEDNLPEISCSIGKIRYGFPRKIMFEDVELTRAEGDQAVLFADTQLTLVPALQYPLKTFTMESKAFGGDHSATFELSDDGKNIEIAEINIAEIRLGELEVFRTRLDRKITGDLSLTGTGTLTREPFTLQSAAGEISVTGGDFELKKTILQQNNMGLDESSVKFTLKQQAIELSEGTIKNKKLNAAFAGTVVLTQPLLSGRLEVKGDIVPLNSLFEEKRQLRTIVTRMQRRYKKSSLPFKVGGTLSAPTFVFGN